MIQIISGEKGKGKTKFLLERANAAIKEAHGSIVYLDKSSKHMYELDRNVRLINVFEYPVHSYDAFKGFLCGIVSQDHDLEQVYLDSFLKLAHLDVSEIEGAIDELSAISEKYDITLVISISADNSILPRNAKEATVVSL